METSTPINSPKRKKHSLIQKFIPIDETLGDIESEIQTRRQEAINKSTESRRRLSAAPLLAGYTASQIAQHCKDVIKLSTENKINCKNAFNFWLIDVMAAMAKKTDSEINKNFQVASCTLDASVKIYGYRVDAIHTDAVKMAGGFFSKDVAAGDPEEKVVENEGEGEGNVVKVKKKRKKLTVVPSESLNAKSEAEILFDIIPRQNFLTRKADGNDLLIKIPKYNDGGLLQLDSEYPCWPFDENVTLVPKFDNREIFDRSGLYALLEEIKLSSEEELCSSYSNFQFGKGCEDNSDSEDDLQGSRNSGRFEFDPNASIHDVDADVENEPEDQGKRIHIPAGGFDSDEDIVVQPEKQKFSENLAISDMKARISVNPSEYSMFDEKIFKAWAGPAHWKIRPVRKPLEEYTNSEDLSKPVASKRTRKGKVKTPVGLFDIAEEVLLKNLTDCEKTILFKSTMLNWNPQNTTMPEDLKCKAKSLFSLYHIPSFTISVHSAEKDNDLGEFSDHNDEKDEEENEGEELEYCSASIVHDGHDGNEYHQMDEEQNFGGGEEAWDLGNMVEAPNRVEKIPVSSFKRRKHVDIKHLKKGLWNILTNGKGERQEEAVLTSSIEFAELVRVFPSKMPKSFGTLLSAPLIFNALLHLTNEKCLVLTQDKTNKLSFLVSQ